MISVELATRLKDAGLVWKPAPGDRFVIAQRDMDTEVFVVSELTIEVHESTNGPVIRFNGTTEWALDSIGQDDAVWLPREDQLRGALGEAFCALEPVGDGMAVTISVDDRTGKRTDRHVDTDAERAYARALLAVFDS